MRREGGARGRAVQVDPMKPMLKPPGTKHLKLKRDVLLSTSAFTFNLRRYTVVHKADAAFDDSDEDDGW